MNKNTENQLIDLREEFKPLAKKYRFYKRIYNIIGFFGVVVVLLINVFSYAVEKNHPLPIKFALIPVFILLLGTLLLSPKRILMSMKCPGCANFFSNTGKIGTFCPYCGEGLVFDSPGRGSHCGYCDQPMQKGRKFDYPLRFHYCNHCSGLLSDELL